MSVFITGASSGIGEACAWQYAAAGHSLVLAARREDRLDRLAEALADKHSVEVAVVALDVRDRNAVDAWGKKFPELSAKTYLLVNNAGGAFGADALQDGNPDDWDAMIDTNIKGLLWVTRALLPALIANRGHIVNVGSVAGHWIYPRGNVYCAVKAAVSALNEAMRMDLHGTGVRVTEIAPGMVQTPFSEVRFKGDKEKAKAVYAGTRPLTAHDIAETIVWCTSRPPHVDIQQVVLFPTDQSSVGMVRRD